MSHRPDVFLLNIAYDITGAHGHAFFRDPPSTELRQVIIRSVDSGTICEPAHGDTRAGCEPILEETRGLIAVIQPDTFNERS